MLELKSFFPQSLLKVVLIANETGMDSDSLTAVIKRVEGIEAFSYAEVMSL
jgi:hypothetical protein